MYGHDEETSRLVRVPESRPPGRSAVESVSPTIAKQEIAKGKRVFSVLSVHVDQFHRSQDSTRRASQTTSVMTMERETIAVKKVNE